MHKFKSSFNVTGLLKTAHNHWIQFRELYDVAKMAQKEKKEMKSIFIANEMKNSTRIVNILEECVEHFIHVDIKMYQRTLSLAMCLTFKVSFNVCYGFLF